MVLCRVFRPFAFRAAVDHYRAEELKRSEAQRLSFRVDDLSCRDIAPGESVGLKRLRLFEETLENGFGEEWRRETVQREFHELCSNALAALILDEDWDRDGPDLRRARGWEVSSRLVICKTARRTGKSSAVAMITAALSIAFTAYPSARDKKIGSFSTGSRASSGLADYNVQLLTVAGALEKQRIVKHNQETLVLRTGDSSDPNGTTITSSFYPSNPKISQKKTLSFP
jgi:hypothetical protein